MLELYQKYGAFIPRPLIVVSRVQHSVHYLSTRPLKITTTPRETWDHKTPTSLDIWFSQSQAICVVLNSKTRWVKNSPTPPKSSPIPELRETNL